MLVVSDTSPIRALHHLALMPVLETLYGRVLVPPAVAQELARGSATSPAVDLSAYPHVVTKVPLTLEPSAAADPDIDPGELEAISLALELGADRLLIDEQRGRAVAANLGIKTIGVLGVLLEAKRAGLIPAVRSNVDRLRKEINFFISDAVRLDVLRRAGE